MPYLAMSSAALAVSACASSGVTPSASALASNLRTRSSSLSDASIVNGAPPGHRQGMGLPDQNLSGRSDSRVPIARLAALDSATDERTDSAESAGVGLR